MKVILGIVVSLSLLALLLFCAFGFLASFEPLPPTIQWTARVIYAGVAILDLFGSFFVWRWAART